MYTCIRIDYIRQMFLMFIIDFIRMIGRASFSFLGPMFLNILSLQTKFSNIRRFTLQLFLFLNLIRLEQLEQYYLINNLC